jgi:hypothetical protein
VANLLSYDSYFALVVSSDHVSCCLFQPVDIQGVIEMSDQILATRLHVEVGKNILKNAVKKLNGIYFFELLFF